uniref:B12-binding domain-containing radical SAM protein n=1 Tax=Fervidicoccus fontis TaxID=683846 RepID=A0A7J3ZJG3_9CREN
MRIALVRVSPRRESKYTSTFGFITPPLGLACVAGAVRDIARVKVIDAEALKMSKDRLLKELEDLDPDIVGFSLNASTYHNAVVQVAQELKKRGAGATIVTGGHHASFTYPILLRQGVDYVVVGEGEQAFRDLVLEIENYGSPERVRGVAYACSESKFCYYHRELVENLDLLPLPAYDLLDRNLYRIEVFGENSRVAAVETARGCPYECEFCSVTMFWGRKWRFKSNERILRELEILKDLGYDWVMVVDDNFIVPSKLKEREQLLDEMKKRGLDRLNYIVQMRSDLIASNPKIVEKLRDAGIRMVFLGIESGDESVLKAMKKSLDTAASVRAVEILSESGILVHGGIVIGAPYERNENLKATFKLVDLLLERGLDGIQVAIYTPLPGTKAFYWALRTGRLLTLEWDYYDCLHPVLKTGLSPWRLLFESRMRPYIFFLKKWLKGRLDKLGRYSKPFAREAKRYILRNLPRYLLGFLTVPLRSIITPLTILARPPKLSEEDIGMLHEVYLRRRAFMLVRRSACEGGADPESVEAASTPSRAS